MSLTSLTTTSMSASLSHAVPEDDGGESHASTGLRVGALFAVLVAGFLGVATPMFFKRWSASPAFTLGKALGAGVILGTAFIHIMPDANENLEDLSDYPVSAALALGALLLTLIVEQLAAIYFESLQKESGHNCATGGECTADRPVVPAPDGGVAIEIIPTSSPAPSIDAPKEEHGHGHGHGHDHGHGHSHGADEAHDERLDAVPHRLHHHHQHSHMAPEGDGARSFVIAHVLEVGIGIHSVIIGIALGTTTSTSEARALLVALCFHQFFEGIALGVSVLEAGLGLCKRVGAVAMFTLATPIGTAIGLGMSIHSDPDSRESKLTQGVFDSVSGGILIYMALVDMVSEEFQAGGEGKKTPMRLAMLLALVVGAGLMAIVGIWA
eukprot:m51a1_g10699 putative zinc transporter chloroplastic-like (382) ;mRNA; f:152292-153501